MITASVCPTQWECACWCWYAAVGCPDLELPATSAAHVIRSADTADVICNDSSTSRGFQHHPDSVEASPGHRRHHHRHHQPAAPVAQRLQSWRLICHGTQWIGDYGNCTRHQSINGDEEDQQQQQQHVYSTEHVVQQDGGNHVQSYRGLQFIMHQTILVVQWLSVGLVIERSLVRLPAGALSSQLGQLSTPSLRGS